jgi:hypothetical protein
MKKKKKKNRIFSEIHESEVVRVNSYRSLLSVSCICGFLIFKFFDKELGKINFQTSPEVNGYFLLAVFLCFF